MPDAYVVVVRHNVVCAIERAQPEPGVRIPATPLEVSTQLAANFRDLGCIDGRYHFDDPQRARIFASLCLEFTKALVEKRLEAVERLRSDHMEYRADDRPDRHGSPPGSS